MSEIITKTWVAQDKEAYDDFNEYAANVLEDGIFRSIPEYFRKKLANADHADLELPWGTYHCDIKGRGETGVVNLDWEPSKGFKKLLNDDSDAASRFDRNYQDTFDPEYIKLFTDWVAYGMFDPDDPKNKDRAAKQRGILLSDPEVTYFLNDFTLVMYNIAKDKQRDGKIYRLEVNNMFPHGTFEFDYKDDGTIDVKYIAHKVTKQAIKDDSKADHILDFDYDKELNFSIEREPKSKKIEDAKEESIPA